MQESDFSEFAKWMAFLESSCQAKPFSADDVDAWFTMLADFPIEAVKAAVIQFGRTVGRFPDTAQISRLANEYLHGLPEDAGEAWERIRKASREWYPGCVESCQRAEAMLNVKELRAVRGLGGFREIQNTPTDQMTILRGQFRKLWDAQTERETRLRNLPESVRPKLSSEILKLTSESVK